MEPRRIRCSAVAAVALLGLAACGEDQENETAAPSGETVQLEPDYPSYDQESMTAEAVLIASGTVIATEHTVLTPTYEGDTPEENPLLGLSEEEKQEAMEQDEGVPATAITFRINEVQKGDASPGDEIVIVQTGGMVDGIEYEASGTTIMEDGVEYLVFAGEGNDGTYNVLGGSAGLYRGSGDTYEAVDPEAPFDSISEDEAESLADEHQ